MTVATNDSKFSTSKWIVSANISDGATHTTVAGAISSASSGDTIFLKPGTYTEDITLIAGITLASYQGPADGGQVKLEGKVTADYTGTSTLNGIVIETNEDYAIESAGTNTCILNIINCNIIASDNSGLNLANANATWNMQYCKGDVSSTGYAMFIVSAGTLKVNFSNIDSSAFSSTTHAFSGGTSTFVQTRLRGIITTSSAANLTMLYCRLIINGSITTNVIIGSTGTNKFIQCQMGSANTPAITVATTCTLDLFGCNITGDDPVITGSGTTNMSLCTFNTGNQQNTVTTQNYTYENLQLHFWKATDFDDAESNVAATTLVNGTNVDMYVRQFDDTTEEFVNFCFPCPDNVQLTGSVTFKVWMYAATAAASKNVQLTFGHVPVGDAEDFDVAYTDVDSGDISIDATQDNLTLGTWTETISNLGWAADDIILARLSRIAATTNDLSGDLNVIMLMIEIPRVFT